MAEGTEIEERVDLEEDNFMEEIDNDVQDQLDEDGEDDAGDAHAEENVEEEYEDSKPEGSQKDQSPEADRSLPNTEPVEDEQKPIAPVKKEEKDKHAQLLSLPPHGSEVFIGGLPKDVIEDELRDLCEVIGEIFEIRLMKDKDTGESKGFAFVAFKSKEVARKATEELRSKDYKGKTLRCSISETKNRLFIGNVPKDLTEDEFKKIIEEVGPGMEVLELIKVELELNSSLISQVKALYVKNIPENSSTEKLKELFQRHGDVTKVVMPPGKSGKRDFGFIHYAERSSALKAVRDTQNYEIDGQLLEVVLAKPQADKKPDGSYPYNAGVNPNPVPLPAYSGFAGNPYGSLGTGFGVAAGFQQVSWSF
ncbi:hypothetical protein H0E87_005112 [Populus deltoides]|uniref:RRM domain-containing protein n=1 Tax=Populus deltoides TaxID=3696 RepID=A0A8T2ZIA8_POPDE|nr:hypothetical protein H0E87_005112 [Populus deltoides]